MIKLYIAKLSLFFAAAPAAGSDCTSSLRGNAFFSFPHWWKYLKANIDSTGTCSVVFHFPNDIWLVGLAVLDILLRLAGFVAVLSIMLAGIQLVAAEGNPEKATSARNRLINSLVGLGIAATATAAVTLLGNTVNGGNVAGLPNVNASTNTIQSLLNIVFAILGAVAFLFIVLAGFRFVTSGDNPNKVSEARRQIIYAALGLIVIAMAGIIVNFVLGKIT